MGDWDQQPKVQERALCFTAALVRGALKPLSTQGVEGDLMGLTALHPGLFTGAGSRQEAAKGFRGYLEGFSL